MKKLMTIMFALVFGLALTTKAEAFVDDTPGAPIDSTVTVSFELAADIGWFISTPGSSSPNELGWASVDNSVDELTVSPQLIQVDYSSNYPAWAVRGYNANTASGGPLDGLTEDERYAVEQPEGFLHYDFKNSGGMIGTDNTDNRVGLAWHGEVTSGSSQPANPDTSVTGDLTGWTFFADTKTFGLVDGGDSTVRSDFVEGDLDLEEGSFANIVIGGAGNVNGALLQAAIPGSGGADFPPAGGSIELWISGGFKGVAPDVYGTEIIFDIVHF